MPFRAAAATLAALYLVVALWALVAGSRDSDPGNLRKNAVILQSGVEASAVRGVAQPGGPHENWLTLDARSADASATWLVDASSYQAVLARADILSAGVVVDAVAAGRAARDANVRVSVDGGRDIRIPCGREHHDRSKGSGLPARRCSDIDSSIVWLTPAIAAEMRVFPVRTQNVRALETHRIVVTAHRCVLRIHRVGLAASFSVNPVAPWTNGAFVMLTAALESAVVVAGFAAVFRRGRRQFGPIGVAVFAAIVSIALFTHDGWDFPLWTHFIDMTLAGANPVPAWSATPLWALVPPLTAPLVAIAPLLHLPFSVMELFALKAVFALAALFTITEIADVAAERRVAVVCAVAPFFVYMLAFGTRDVVAVALACVGLHAAARTRPWLATLAFAGATSVSEYLAPLMLIPSYLTLRGGLPSARRIGLAALFPLSDIAAIGVQWALLDAHTRSHTASFRLGRPEFFGATWQRVFAEQHLMPGIENLTTVYAGYACYVAAVCAVSIVMLVHTVKKRERAIDPLGEALGYAAPLVSLFFLVYRGIDPQEWYGPLLIVAYAAARRKTALLPIAMFSTFAFLTIYVFSGLRGYLAPEFFRMGVFSLFDGDPGLVGGFCLGAIASLVLSTASLFDRTGVAEDPGPLLILPATLGTFVLAPVAYDPAVLLSGGTLVVLGLLGRNALPRDVTWTRIATYVLTLGLVALCARWSAARNLAADAAIVCVIVLCLLASRRVDAASPDERSVSCAS